MSNYRENSIVQSIKMLDDINQAIKIKLQRIIQLREMQDEEMNVLQTKINELAIDKKLHYQNDEELSTSSEQKDSNAEKSLRMKIETAMEELKSMFELLGIEMELQDFDENIVKVKLSFLEDVSATFNYDIRTDDFDLVQIFPEVENFSRIRSFLRETGDFSGFLYCLWEMSSNSQESDISEEVSSSN